MSLEAPTEIAGECGNGSLGQCSDFSDSKCEVQVQPTGTIHQSISCIMPKLCTLDVFSQALEWWQVHIALLSGGTFACGRFPCITTGWRETGIVVRDSPGETIDQTSQNTIVAVLAIGELSDAVVCCVYCVVCTL